MRTLVITAVILGALFTVPAFAQSGCEKPDPTDKVTKSDAGEFRQKPLAVGDFTNAKGECKRLIFTAGSPKGFVFATMDMSDAIAVDTIKNTLVVVREGGKDVEASK